MGCVARSQLGWNRSFNYFFINWESTLWHAHMLVPTHRGIQGEHTLKHIKREINKVLPEDQNMELVFKGLSLELNLI